MLSLFRPSFAARLTLMIAVVTAALVAMAVTAHVKLTAVVQAAQRTEQVRIPQLDHIAKMELKFTQVSLQLRQGMLARNAAELDAAVLEIARLQQEIAGHQQAYEQGLFTAAGRQRYAALPPAEAAFWLQAEASLALLREQRRDEAFAHLVARTLPAHAALVRVLGDTLQYQEKSLAEDIQGVAQRVAHTLQLLEFLVLLIGLGMAIACWRLVRVLRRRLALAQGFAEKVRDGDLSVSVADTRRDELSPLLQALREMQGALTRLVGDVRGNAEGVATASQQIAQGNLDLSSRTEEQAAALQQTAATMDELGTTVRHNADSAQDASQLARNASLVAARGGAVVARVVGTMGEIQQAAARIADITAVIDSIAFQTNILALNAAVEAARAGEEGRGFAVVAGEVRTLAQRSAAAAREIKALIGTSVDRVEQGSALVDEAGQTMGEIVTAIDRVNQIVAEISDASREQSHGVGQVGEAVNQMDRATQQNAALVEESAAAAESLKQQAARLVQAVAVFRLQAEHA